MGFFLSQEIRKYAFLSSVFYLIFYISISVTIYSLLWYDINFQSQNLYEVLERGYVEQNKINMIDFFLYKSDLNDNWLYEEKVHLNDVRNIYAVLFILGLISFFIIGFFWDKKYIKVKYFIINIFILLSLLLILPFFRFFWDEIFHLIMFRNNYWIIIENSLFYLLLFYHYQLI